MSDASTGWPLPPLVSAPRTRARPCSCELTVAGKMKTSRIVKSCSTTLRRMRRQISMGLLDDPGCPEVSATSWALNLEAVFSGNRTPHSPPETLSFQNLVTRDAAGVVVDATTAVVRYRRTLHDATADSAPLERISFVILCAVSFNGSLLSDSFKLELCWMFPNVMPYSKRLCSSWLNTSAKTSGPLTNTLCNAAQSSKVAMD